MKVGSSSITTTDQMELLLGKLGGAAFAATLEGAAAVEAELRAIFDGEGNGQWPPNQPSTIERKGDDKQVMEDLRQLVNGVERIPETIIMSPTHSQIGVGWSDRQTHTSHGPIGMASLADIHDRGFEELGIPARPWISQLAHDPEAESRIYERMALAFFGAMA